LQPLSSTSKLTCYCFLGPWKFLCFSYIIYPHGAKSKTQDPNNSPSIKTCQSFILPSVDLQACQKNLGSPQFCLKFAVITGQKLQYLESVTVSSGLAL